MKKISKVPYLLFSKIKVILFSLKILLKKFLDNFRDYSKVKSLPLKLDQSGHCFAAQSEYFRSNYYDMLEIEGNFEYPILPEKKDNLQNLKSFCYANNIKTLWLYRPEWFTSIKEDLEELRENGVSIIGFSTEPIPTLNDFLKMNSHIDQMKRLISLFPARKLQLDRIIHFDSSSESLLKYLGFKNLICHPLPVSRSVFDVPSEEIKYDICFIGRPTEYREFFLSPLKAFYKVIHIAHGLFDEDAAKLMASSRIVLNLHNEKYLNFEDRLVQIKFSKSIVFSQPLTMNEWLKEDEYVEFKYKDELLKKVESVLREKDASVIEKYRNKFDKKESFYYSSLLKVLSLAK